MGIRLAEFVVDGFRARGDDVELIDAKAVGLPMLDRMYKEYPKGEAPAALEKLAGQDPRCRWLRLHHRRIQLGHSARSEKSHRSFPRRVVLAPRRHRELFGRPFRGRARGDRMARHALRNGDGGGFIHHRGRPDRARPCRWTAKRQARAARRWSGPFRASPTISPGGWKPQPSNGSEGGRRFELPGRASLHASRLLSSRKLRFNRS